MISPLITFRKWFWLPYVWRMRRERKAAGLKLSSVEAVADLMEEIENGMIEAKKSNDPLKKAAAESARATFTRIFPDYG